MSLLNSVLDWFVLLPIFNPVIARRKVVHERQVAEIFGCPVSDGDHAAQRQDEAA